MADNPITDEKEYIAFIAAEFCCDKTIVKNETDKVFLEEDTKINVFNIFDNRYPKLKEQNLERYESYRNEESLIRKIEKYGYEVNKFWLLTLFIADYTESCYGKSWVMSKETIGETVIKMIELLNDPNSSITINTDKGKPLKINNHYIKQDIKDTLTHFFDRNPLLKGALYCTGETTDNVLYHKWKFFIDMLNYFLNNYNTVYAEQTKGRTDWAFIAQCLYVAGLTEQTNYLTGYNDWTDARGLHHHDKNKYIGKEIKDSIKNCKDTANRNNSNYFFYPEEEY